jgi:hypothetical protein
MDILKKIHLYVIKHANIFFLIIKNRVTLQLLS